MAFRKQSGVTTADPKIRLLAAGRAMRAAASRRRPGSPAELAQRLDPKFRVTPTIALLSDIAVRAVTDPDQRDIVTTPPRTGKSRLLAVWLPVWALMRDPDMSLMLISYSDELAQAHSREIRRIVNEHSEFLGYSIAADLGRIGRWAVEGHRGGVLAGGIQSGATGFGADLLLIDDPVKDAAEADSAAHRRRIIGEYRSSLATRVHPGGSTLIVQTRWHPEDLAGMLLDAEPEVWTYTNIPAVAEAGVPDALGREPGTAMVSALGFTPEHYAAARRTSGERAWYALYEGQPASPEGNLIKRDWIDSHRLIAAPRGPSLTLVAVDPADSGEGDKTGIIGAMLGRDGTIALTHDVSDHLTSDAWANRAVELAIQIGASQIHVEGYATATTYVRLLREAVDRAQPPHPIMVSDWRGKGDALARAQGLIAGLETGRCRVAGVLPQLESDACGWQAGQHCPDSVAAAVIGFEVLAKAVGSQIVFGVPGLDGLSSGATASVTNLRDYLSQKIG